MSDHAHKKHPDIPVEPDVMPSGKLFVWVGAMCAIVIVLTILIWQEFNRASDQELQKKQLTRIWPAQLEARRADRLLATGYGVVNKKKNLYRIPISMAQDMVMRTPTLLLPADIPDDKPAKPAKPAKTPEKPTKPETKSGEPAKPADKGSEPPAKKGDAARDDVPAKKPDAKKGGGGDDGRTPAKKKTDKDAPQAK